MMKLVMDDGHRHAVSVQPEKSLLNIPGYEIAEEIARGGMGIVYRAMQLKPRREVALKMLLPHQATSPGMVERFHLEARAIAALEHSAILPVHQVGEHNGLPFFTMKLATGGTLADRKAQFRGKWRAIAELMATLADAVQFAHERGVLHRDLKPGNVLFDEHGHAYISDFGLAKVAGTDSDLTRSIELLGTPHYMAPEVAAHSAKNATIASDIYSLGAILYELVAGHPPFEAEGVPALLRKIAEEEPVPASRAIRLDAPVGSPDQGPATKLQVPRDLEVICLKCLTKEPPRRYVTARDLSEDLRRWLGGHTILARPATRVERVRSWMRRNPALAVMSSLLVLVLFVALIWQARSNSQLQDALFESFLREARLERNSGQMGHRFDTLTLISRALRQTQGLWRTMTRSNLVSLRTETAAALALADGRPLARWPAHITHFENAFDFSTDLERYVTGAPDGGFTIFSTPNQKALYRVAGQTNNPAVSVRLSADGNWAAAQFQDGHAELHSLSSKRPPCRWPANRESKTIFAFAESRPRFAVVGRPAGKAPVAEVIDLETGMTQAEVPANASVLAFNRSGTHLAMAGPELSIWRLADTNRLWSTPLTRHPAALTWSGDGRRLALSLSRQRSGGDTIREPNPVLLFDATTGQQESVFAEFDSDAARLEFSADSRSLVAATWNDQLMWGSVPTKEYRLILPGSHRALRHSPDGRRLAYAPSKEELGLVELATPAVWHEWQMVSPPASQTFSLDTSADGQWVITSAVDGLHLWDVKQRREMAFHSIPLKPWWMTAFFGPDDAFVYYSAANFGIRRVELLRTNAPDGQRQLQFGSAQYVGPPRDNLAPGLASDGRSLIVGTYQRQSQNERSPPTMWLWSDGDPAKARKLAENFPMVGYRQIPGTQWGVTTDRVTPDAWIWNFETGQQVRGLGIPAQVNSEPTANGRWLATRTRQEFVVWQVGTWRAISRWPARRDEQDSGNIIASRDSRLLATDTSDGALVLRELPGGAELLTLTPPRLLTVRHWAFSPDGSRLIVVARGGQVVEWDLAELRRELAKLELEWQ